MDLPATTLPNSSHRSFLPWLGAAVLLHGLMLLLPDGRGPGGRADLTTLSVRINRPLQYAPQPPTPATRAEPTLPPREGRSPPPRMESAAPDRDPTRETPKPPAPIEPIPQARIHTPSAAMLFESTERLRLPGREAEATSRLGRHLPTPPPPNWSSGLPAEEDRFSGRALPDRVEVVDRWLAADGSHNVLVETPSGEVYCGRAAAWDPMQPLLEPVMMFRACGNGRKTFEWPEAYRNRSGNRYSD